MMIDCLRGCFFFQAEDGIRDLTVTGVQTCALPICRVSARGPDGPIDRTFWQFALPAEDGSAVNLQTTCRLPWFEVAATDVLATWPRAPSRNEEIPPGSGKASPPTPPPRKRGREALKGPAIEAEM